MLFTQFERVLLNLKVFNNNFKFQAYDDEDWEGVQRALQSPFIKHMDVDYARLANAVPLPEGIKNVPKGATKPTVVSNAQQAYTSPPPEEVFF